MYSLIFDLQCLMGCRPNFFENRGVVRRHLDIYAKMVDCLPEDKIFSWYKLKTYADDKVFMSQRITFGFEEIENIVREK